MSSDVLWIALATVAGGALSVPMFVGLWWTLRHLPMARHPALFALASFWLRLTIVIAGFFLITAGDWRRGAAALVGFLAVRTWLLWRLGRTSTGAAEGV